MAAHPVIGIAGAGAVGLHYGLALQRAGLEVRFLARGEHLLAMQRDGLRYIRMGQESRERVACSDDPAILAGCDIIMLACKTTQLQAMLKQLTPHIGINTQLLTMQNGVTAAAEVHQHFPQHTVIAASAFIGACVVAPGVLEHSAAGHLRLGVWHGEGQGMIDSLCAHWQQGGVDARRVADIDLTLWQKMLWNCGFNAITALTRRYARDVALDAGLAHWARQAMEETCRVAHCIGIALDRSVIDNHFAVTLQGGPVKTSMWQDVEHHRPVEIAALNGHVVRLADQYGVDVPVNRIVCDLIRGLSDSVAS